MNDVAEIGWHVTQLAVAFLLALPIARDREHIEWSAGLRTFTLVAISTCGFLIAKRNTKPADRAGVVVATCCPYQ